MESSSSTSSWPVSETVIQTLVNRGWCFGETTQVKALITIQSALHGDSFTVESMESELSNMDLRSIGGKSLPDPSNLRAKTSRLQGPKVLQISSARDISRSCIAESSGNTSSRRLLRLKLTDGDSEITAIEYSHIPSIPDDVVPGTKVRFENNAVIHNGIVCLNSKVITLLGGVVQPLYEEWQMNQKYSGFSRSSLKLSQNGDTGGPPPFEKLQVGAPSRRSTQQGKFSQFSASTSKSSGPSFVEKDGGSGSRQINKLPLSDLKSDSMNNDVKSVSVNERNDGKTPCSESRPREVAEFVPVQNQAAAQKLLQKMNQPGRNDWYSRGGKHRGRGKQLEEAPVLTLDEWEKRKASAKSSIKQEIPGVGSDEGLAHQLQNQFDLEDRHVQRGPQMTEADQIRMSMFSFERDDSRGDDRCSFTGRGRRRGRGRGRGRFG